MAGNNYGGSTMNWGQGNSYPALSGGQDYLAQLTPATSGLDMGGIDMGGGGAANPGFFSMQSLLGGTDANGMKTPGWGGAALGVAQGLGNAYMAMKQFGLAKDTFNENKRQFGLNFDAQKKTTNSRLEDRQRARVASNAGAYQSVGDYMAKNGI